MSEKIRKWLQKLTHKQAYAVIQRKGYHAQVMYIEDRLLAAARFAVAEAERVGANVREGGLFKRQQAMQMLSNIVPDALEHDCANAIQVAIELVKRA